METSEREVRALVRAVDELHRDGMASMASDIAELHEGEGARLMGPTRQQLARGIGLGGAAVALGAAMVPLSQLFSPAYAQAGDAGLAAFAQSVERAAVEACKAAAASGKVTTPAGLEAATTFAGHHTEHAAAFGAAAGSSASDAPNAKLLAVLSPQLTAAADENAVVDIAYMLENAAASTYLFALGALTSRGAVAVQPIGYLVGSTAASVVSKPGM